MVPSARQARVGWDLLIASAGRFATGLLSLRYIDGTYLGSYSRRRLATFKGTG
jgi:hypothetical protein